MAGYIGSKRSSSLVSATDITLDGAKLKSSGDSITKSDGTTAVLSESSGTVTLTADEAIIEGSSSGDLVRITQTGSGNALVVEDKANPDGTPFVIDASGNVGVGTSSPSRKLHSYGGTDDNCALLSSLAGNAYIGFADSGTSSQTGLSVRVGSDGNDFIIQTGGTNTRMRIDSSGSLILAGSTAQKASGTNWTNPSDIRLKENITNYSKGISELIQINVKQWEYNGKGGTISGQIGLGVIANEIESVLPNTVDTYSAKLNEDDETETDIKKFDATEITWLLVNTCKEQQTIIESQQSQIDALTEKTQEQDSTIASLISRIEALET